MEIAQSMHRRELNEVKEDCEKQLKELKQHLAFRDASYKTLQLQIESMEID